jgi:RimJ/RimL family protein N-acetyltransferase
VARDVARGDLASGAAPQPTRQASRISPAPAARPFPFRDDGVVTAARETERLLLVPITTDHALDLRRMYQDPWLARWLTGPWSDEQAQQYAASSAEVWRRDGIHKWMVYERSTGELVGRGGLSRMMQDVHPTTDIDALLGDPTWRSIPLEVGWAVTSRFRGNGMAVEIGQAAIALARDELGASRIIAFTERHNAASRRVMEKLGMSCVGEIPWRGLVEGQDEEQDDAPFAVYATPHDREPGSLPVLGEPAFTAVSGWRRRGWSGRRPIDWRTFRASFASSTGRSRGRGTAPRRVR